MTTTSASGRARRVPWLFVLGLLVFAFALLSKWEKWPAGTALLIASAVLAWSGVLVHRVRGEEGRTTNWMRAALAAMVLYVVSRLLYWPMAMVAGIAAVIIAALALHAWWRDRSSVVVPTVLGFVLAATIGLMAVPTHAVFHYMFFVTPGAQRWQHSGIGHWYRYSWMLYQDGQFEKSAAMLDSATAEIQGIQDRTGRDGTWILNELHNVRAQVDARDWQEFHELHRPEK